MKNSGFTMVFVIICVGVLVAAYGVGVCIREIRFSRARAETKLTAENDQTETESQAKSAAQERPTPADKARQSEDQYALETQGADDGPPRPMMGERGGVRGMPTREELQNMSEEERREVFAKMRERFGGRRREGGPQLSEEDRAQLREELEQLRERSEDMSEEERAEARAKIFEKYGITPRGPGGRPGGGRGFGGEGGGRRRSRPDEGQ